VLTSWTTRCCSVLVLIAVVGVRSAALSTAPRPFPWPKWKASRAIDRGPLSLFPVHTIWTLALNNQITVPPAYDESDGYFAIEQSRVAAYNLSTGTQKWVVSANPRMEPAVGDALLFLIEPSTLTALHTADGSIAWQLPFAETLVVPPVWDSGWLIAATAAEEILAFRGTDGRLIWRRAIGSAAHARPSLAADRVYVPTDDGRVVALQVETGEPLWERKIGGAANEILALDERLYVGSKDNYMYCLLTERGTIDWRWRTGADVIGKPVVDKRRVYFVALDNVLRALDRTSGAQQWKDALPLRPNSGPLQAGDTLIVTGLAPSMRGYQATDGKAAGEIAAGGELAAPPHLHGTDAAPVPIVIAVTRDIAKGATVSAIARVIDPEPAPIGPLPNLILVSPATPAGAPRTP
jgi:outer membrane protein assembly factor BamB